MRVSRNSDEFIEMLESAKRESKKSCYSREIH